MFCIWNIEAFYYQFRWNLAIIIIISLENVNLFWHKFYDIFRGLKFTQCLDYYDPTSYYVIFSWIALFWIYCQNYQERIFYSHIFLYLPSGVRASMQKGSPLTTTSCIIILNEYTSPVCVPFFLRLLCRRSSGAVHSNSRIKNIC